MKYMEGSSLYRLLMLKISKGVMSPLNQSMMSLEVKQITKKQWKEVYGRVHHYILCDADL